jgi:hypothetical protein
MSQKRAFTLKLDQPGRLKVTTMVKIEVDAMLTPDEMSLLKRKLAGLFMQAHTEMQQLRCYVSDIKLTDGIKR